MDNYENLNVEQQEQCESPKTESRFSKLGTAVTSMVFGILSIWLGVLPGIVLSIFAIKFSNSILKFTDNEKEYIFAKIGNVTGIVGLVMSVTSLVLLFALIMLYLVIYIFVILLAIASSGMMYI